MIVEGGIAGDGDDTAALRAQMRACPLPTLMVRLPFATVSFSLLPMMKFSAKKFTSPGAVL